MAKVWVFVEANVVSKPGYFDKWCAFADTEVEAEMRIRNTVSLGGRELKLVNSFDDRRKPRDRRSDERRVV